MVEATGHHATVRPSRERIITSFRIAVDHGPVDQLEDRHLGTPTTPEAWSCPRELLWDRYSCMRDARKTFPADGGGHRPPCHGPSLKGKDYNIVPDCSGPRAGRSVGRSPPWHGGGHGFKSRPVHSHHFHARPHHGPSVIRDANPARGHGCSETGTHRPASLFPNRDDA